MKNIFLLIAFVLTGFLFSCKTNQNTDSTITTSKKFDEKTFDPHFKGLGTEPFWGIELDDDFIVYNNVEGIKEVYEYAPTDILINDSFTEITAKSKNKQLKLKLYKKSCSDGMSDAVYDYKTDVSIIDQDTAMNLNNGCGNYIVPKKLQGKWNLISLNNEEIPADKYLKTPYLEFNEEKQVSGNTSCNGFNGTIIFNKEKMKFSKLGVTRMMCVHENMEATFLKEIATVTTYKIQKNELQLFNGSELKMTFLKQE